MVEVVAEPEVEDGKTEVEEVVAVAEGIVAEEAEAEGERISGAFLAFSPYMLCETGLTCVPSCWQPSTVLQVHGVRPLCEQVRSLPLPNRLSA